MKHCPMMVGLLHRFRTHRAPPRERCTFRPICAQEPTVRHGVGHRASSTYAPDVHRMISRRCGSRRRSGRDGGGTTLCPIGQRLVVVAATWSKLVVETAGSFGPRGRRACRRAGTTAAGLLEPLVGDPPPSFSATRRRPASSSAIAEATASRTSAGAVCGESSLFRSQAASIVDCRLLLIGRPARDAGKRRILPVWRYDPRGDEQPRAGVARDEPQANPGNNATLKCRPGYRAPRSTRATSP